MEEWDLGHLQMLRLLACQVLEPETKASILCLLLGLC